MSDFDVLPDDMKWLANISDRDADRVLAGKGPDGRADLEGVARFVDELSAAFPESSTEDLESAHVSAMMEAARVAAAAAAASVRVLPLADPDVGPMDRLRAALAPRGMRIALASGFVALALGGTAYAGVLPAPVQRAVAKAVRVVGIEIPSPQPGEADMAPRVTAPDASLSHDAPSQDAQGDQDTPSVAPKTPSAPATGESDEHDAVDSPAPSRGTSSSSGGAASGSDDAVGGSTGGTGSPTEQPDAPTE